MVRNINETLLPHGWCYDYLDKFAKRGSGHTPNKNILEYWNGGIKWISLADSSKLDNGFIYETDKEISEIGIKNSSAVLHPEKTVVLSRDAGVGKSAVMFQPMAASQHFIAWRCDNKNKLNSWFLYNWLQMMKPEFERQAVGSTIKTIGLPYFKKLKIAVPPIDEQTKIVQILSSWDKAIEKLEALIANKQKRKKALMQQLLTGKKRFARFDVDWKKWFLKDLGDTFNGLTGKNKDDFGFGDPYIPYMNIFKNNCIDVNQFELVNIGELERQIKVQYGDIFFTTSSETPNEVGMSSVLLNQVEDVYLNSFCFGFRLYDFDTLLPEFARYLFRAEHIRKQVSILAQGATRYNLSKTQLLKISLELPSTGEQQKIATVLSVADKEIVTHQKQLAALKQQKKGLMQQLLTGKRRVQLEKDVEIVSI